MKELKDDIFYTVETFSQIRQCSVVTARDIYNAKDFPCENFGKEKVALGSAIREWYRQKRDKKSKG